MSKRASPSAGLLLFRRNHGRLEVFLAHPGGPFWQRKDAGAWTIPKGAVEAGESYLDAARREFVEETGIAPMEPFIPLGQIRQRSGKVIHAWAWEGDADPATIVSQSTETEWPRKSGRIISFPEIDRCAWFTPEEAMPRINAAQGVLIQRLASTLGLPG